MEEFVRREDVVCCERQPRQPSTYASCKLSTEMETGQHALFDATSHLIFPAYVPWCDCRPAAGWLTNDFCKDDFLASIVQSNHLTMKKHKYPIKNHSVTKFSSLYISNDCYSSTNCDSLTTE